VGCCKVFHVSTLATDGSHPYDSIALEIDGERVYINNLSCLGNQTNNSVTITKPGKVNRNGEETNCLTFSSVSADFLSWALARMPRNHEAAHFNFFERNSMVRVECGGAGNCFFLSCLFLLKIEVPHFTFKMVRERNRKFPQQEETFSLSQTSHAILRRATCQHLRKHFAEICVSDGIPVIDTIKMLKDFGKDLSDEDIVGRYCDQYEKLGVSVENPMVVAFAHFCQLSLTIFHVSHAGLYLVSHPQPVNSLAQNSGLFCNEWHYQASIYR
jgi:hypothetical protein